MHQIEATEAAREHHRWPREINEGSPYPSAHRGTTAVPRARLRVVRVPGGFAYVEERHVTERS
jgi:hypothetical protein